MKLKLHRDIVISNVNGRDLVGVYIIVKKSEHLAYISDGKITPLDNAELLLAEMNPKKADAIIKLWNAK